MTGIAPFLKYSFQFHPLTAHVNRSSVTVEVLDAKYGSVQVAVEQHTHLKSQVDLNRDTLLGELVQNEGRTHQNGNADQRTNGNIRSGNDSQCETLQSKHV